MITAWDVAERWGVPHAVAQQWVSERSFTKSQQHSADTFYGRKANGPIDAQTFASCMGITHGQARDFLSSYCGQVCIDGRITEAAFAWREYNEASTVYQEDLEPDVKHGVFGNQAGGLLDDNQQHGVFGNQTGGLLDDNDQQVGGW